MTTIGDLLVEFKEKPKPGQEIPVLTLTEHNGFVRQADRFNKRVATEDISNYKVVRRNDIAFNPYLLWAGAVAQNTIVDEGVISPLYPTFRARDGYDPRYVARLLLAPQLIRAYDSIAFGSVPRRRRSSVKDFLALRVGNVPPVEEQRWIARMLDRADSIRVKRRQALTHLDTLAQAVFHDMFGDPEAWPSRWQMGVIGDMTESVQYGTSAKAGSTGCWPILRMGNVTDRGRLDLASLKYIDLSESDIPKYTTRRGDLLFNRTNSKDKVGKTCVVDFDEPFAIAGYLIRVRLNSQHRPEFVSAYLTSKHGRAVRLRMAKTAVNQANINATEMRRIPIALPPEELQDLFVHRIQQVNAQRAVVQRALDADNELFGSLQARAFQGKL